MKGQKTAQTEANKALKWIVRSGTAQIILGTLTASSIAYLNKEIALVVFITNLISVIGQGAINYLDYLKSELNK